MKIGYGDAQSMNNNIQKRFDAELIGLNPELKSMYWIV